MRALVALLLAVAALAASAVPALATEFDRLSPARAVLTLTGERLALMRGVMATKWAARTPVEDRAQEATVLATARENAIANGLEPESVAAFYEQQITAAKEVQLGWGGRWLLWGFPADEPVPDLATVRGQLAALNPGLIANLSHLDQVACAKNLRERLLRVAARRITAPYVTEERRAAIVDVLIAVHPAGGAPRCAAT